MGTTQDFKTISECAQAFPHVTESTLRRWIKNGRIPDDALLITESSQKAGRMVTLIDTEHLKTILREKAKAKPQNVAVASNGTNQTAGNWEQIKRPYEDFIEFLKQEVESQRLRAEEAEERTREAEQKLLLLTHQPPDESKAKAKGESNRNEWGFYALIVVVCLVLVALMLQQFKYV